MAHPFPTRRSRPRPTVTGLWTICFILGLVSLSVLSRAEARSQHPRPHPRVNHPSSISIDVIPKNHPHRRSGVSSNAIERRRKRHLVDENRKRLNPDESIRISFSLPSVSSSLPETIHLHLTPNPHLLHPLAQIHHYSSSNSGGRTRSLALKSDDLPHRGYHGHVVHPSYSFQRLAEDLAGGIAYDRSGEGKRGVLGWASLTVHEESVNLGGEPLFEGAFQVDRQVYHVMSRENWERHRKGGDAVVGIGGEGGRMVVFLEGDHNNVDWAGDMDQTLEAPDGHGNGTSGCSHDRIGWNTDASHPVYRQPLHPSFDTIASPFDVLFPLRVDRSRKRDDISTGGGYSNNGNFISTIGNTAGCPTTLQIIYMGVNADCNYVSTYGSAEAAKTQILTNWNTISALYRSSFNISLGLIEMNIANETCPASTTGQTAWNTACDDSTTLDERLSTFSQWRGTYGDTRAGIYHLMSACPTNTEVGVAWLGTMCQTDATAQGQYVSSTGVSTATKVEWSLISHEIGHNFGAIHDCTSGCSLNGSCCPFSSASCDASGSYIMNPTTSSTEVKFSPCTEGNICSLMQNRAVNTSCMQTPGSLTVLSLQSCGNGIVESGEDCDPGPGVSSACCDSATCKFTSGSVCDYNSDLCCTESCGYASNSTVCRPAVDTTCDVAEYCTGSNATCPADVVTSDGTSCGSDNLACAAGTCTSLDLQCQQVGVTLNLTQACNSRGDTSCLVTCQSTSSSSSCLILQSPLLDGSPCGYGGHCYNQTCESGTWQDTAGSWYRSNLNISIPVTIAVSLLVLAILWGLLRCCFCRGRRRAVPAGRGKSRRRAREAMAPQMMAQQPFNGLPPPTHGGPYHGPPQPYASNPYSNPNGMGAGQYRPQSYIPPSGPAPWQDGQEGVLQRPQSAYYGVDVQRRQ